MGFDDVHDRVVGIFVGPVALPLQHHSERGDRLRARLDDALHGITMRKFAHVAAAVFDYVHLVAVVDCLHRRQRDAGLGPQAGKDNLLATRLPDRADEVLVVPGIHGRAFDQRLLPEHRLDLGPHVAAEALGLDGREHDRDVKYPRSLAQYEIAVDDALAIVAGDAEEHVRLQVDDRDHAVVGGEQALLAQLGSVSTLHHDVLLTS